MKTKKEKEPTYETTIKGMKTLKKTSKLYIGSVIVIEDRELDDVPSIIKASIPFSTPEEAEEILLRISEEKGKICFENQPQEYIDKILDDGYEYVGDECISIFYFTE